VALAEGTENRKRFAERLKAPVPRDEHSGSGRARGSRPGKTPHPFRSPFATTVVPNSRFQFMSSLTRFREESAAPEIPWRWCALACKQWPGKVHISMVQSPSGAIIVFPPLDDQVHSIADR
jgi:hypothetical protein